VTNDGRRIRRAGVPRPASPPAARHVSSPST